jgi:hypothetical protein
MILRSGLPISIKHLLSFYFLGSYLPHGVYGYAIVEIKSMEGDVGITGTVKEATNVGIQFTHSPYRCSVAKLVFVDFTSEFGETHQIEAGKRDGRLDSIDPTETSPMRGGMLIGVPCLKCL